MPELSEEVAAQVEALVKVGRHSEAAQLCARAGDLARAGELYAAVWQWADAIAVTEHAGLYDRAYQHALEARDRGACGRLLAQLEAHPGQAVRAAVYAESKGQPLDAARLREAAGEIAAAAELYERGGELRDAARCRLALGELRKAGMLLERRLEEHPDDGETALALGRILAQFGRWDHAVRALQRAAESPAEEPAALRLMIACFAAMGMDAAAGSRLDALRALEPETPLTVPELLERTFGDRRGALALALAGEGEPLLAGRYRVLRPLGAGGTGRVLLARDAFHEREVAVKVLNVGGGGAGRDAFVRFAREARVAAGISHPNVVSVYEFNPEGPFLVMEYMAGGTLEDRIVGPDDSLRPYPPEQTWHVARAVLTALEVVHRRGVVHRDLKPANVFFDGAGSVKLGDFGVAHLTDLGATLTGALMGTLAYMAPEQITGSQKPEAATDLYALGVILFRCLTGRLPFEGPDFVTQHLEEQPPRASAVAPWLTDAFDAVLERCLAKDPDARFGSASDLLDALRPLPWASMAVPEQPSPSVHPAARSEAPPAPTAERYQPLGSLGEGVTLARDELLERAVELVPIDAPTAARLRRFARADGPHLQAVYESDDALGRAGLEHPPGAWREQLPADDPRWVRTVHEIRAAVRQLHAERLVHGAVGPSQVVVGTRACLRLSLRASADDPQADWAGLDAMGGRGMR